MDTSGDDLNFHDCRQEFKELISQYFSRTLTRNQLDDYKRVYQRSMPSVKRALEKLHSIRKPNREGFRELPMPYEIISECKAFAKEQEMNDFGATKCPKCYNTGEMLYYKVKSPDLWVYTKMPEKHPSISIREYVGYCSCASGKRLHTKRKARIQWNIVERLNKEGYAFQLYKTPPRSYK